MKLNAQPFVFALTATTFIGLPLLLYVQGEAPVRSWLKEGLSVLTILAFTLMLMQYFLARSNETLLRLFKGPSVQKVHKYIAYSAISILALHPFLIVLPRYFEAGIKPWDAFWIMVTNVNSLGVVLGLIAWAAMISLGITAYARTNLMRRFKNRYRGWRAFHAFLAVSFTVVAIWHAIELGRHTDLAMSSFFLVIATLGVGMLAGLYRPERTRKSPPAPLDTTFPQGAK